MKGSCGNCDGYLDWPRECPSCLTWFCGTCISSHECPLEDAANFEHGPGCAKERCAYNCTGGHWRNTQEPICIHGTDMAAFCWQCDEDE